MTEDGYWRVDGEGYLLTPSGAKAARVHDGALWLWDKRAHCEVPFTPADWQALFCETRVTQTGK